MDFKQFKEKYQKIEIREYPHKVTSTPLVSVMVQTYQHQKFIKDCLDSILKQETNFPFEILLGEDCSNDGTREVCIEYAEKHPEKIRLFLHQPENKIRILDIPTGNFNALYNFFFAKGEFVAFCEGDDLWRDPLKLQKQVEALRLNSDFSFTYHSYIEVDNVQRPLIKDLILEQPTQDISKEDVKKLTCHPLLSTICFRNFGKELPEQMSEVINVDSFLISLLGNYGGAGYLSDIEPSFYRRHRGGMWSNRQKKVKYLSKMRTYSKLTDYYGNIDNQQMTEYYKPKLRNIFKMFILMLLKKGELKEAFNVALKMRKI